MEVLAGMLEVRVAGGTGAAGAGVGGGLEEWAVFSVVSSGQSKFWFMRLRMKVDVSSPAWPNSPWAEREAAGGVETGLVSGGRCGGCPGCPSKLLGLSNLVCAKYSEDCEDSDLAAVLFFPSKRTTTFPALVPNYLLQGKFT